MDLSSGGVSDLLAGAAADFTAERLVRLLNRLGVAVSVVLRDEIDWKPGSTSVHFGREQDARSLTQGTPRQP
jgi:hypothetical protein